VSIRRKLGHKGFEPLDRDGPASHHVEQGGGLPLRRRIEEVAPTEGRVDFLSGKRRVVGEHARPWRRWHDPWGRR
jgi:hypothetical protein